MKHRIVVSIKSSVRALMLGRAAYCIILLHAAGLAQDARAQEAEMVEVTAPQFHQVVKESGATLAVVNLWATWCPPCIEEFPYFMKLGKDLADHGVKVFFVSMDVAADRPAIQAFLAKQGYSGTSYLRAGTDHAFITALHETWTGVLPATLLYSQNGSLADFWVGKPVNYKALKKRVLKALHP